MTPAPISVERLRELLEKATSLPWRWSDNGNIVPAAYPHAEWDFEIAAVYTERDDDEAPANAELIIAAVNALPALLQQLAELERDNATMRGADYHQVGVEQEQEIIDLEAKLAEREAEVERLRRECDLRKHAVDRWVPCPDHRDKTDGRCYVCASEAAERAREEAMGLLRKIDGLIPSEILGTRLCEELDALLAANK